MIREELILKYLSGEATQKEKTRILEWYKKSPKEAQKEIDRVRVIFEGFLLNDISVKNNAVRKVHWRLIASVAACIALVVVSMFVSRKYTIDNIGSQMASLEVPSGQRVAFTLPDGTSVWLNSESKMEYPPVFSGKERRIRLSGEALLDVVSDVKKPFIVETYCSEIRVLGTRFDVIADEANDYFCTSLLRGSVLVNNKLNGDNIILSPNQSVVITRGEMVKSTNLDSDAFLWNEGIISLCSATFAELMIRFEKVYNVNIHVEAGFDPQMKTRGKVRVADGVCQALDVLRTHMNFNYIYDRENNQIEIFADK